MNRNHRDFVKRGRGAGLVLSLFGGTIASIPLCSEWIWNGAGFLPAAVAAGVLLGGWAGRMTARSGPRVLPGITVALGSLLAGALGATLVAVIAHEITGRGDARATIAFMPFFVVFFGLLPAIGLGLAFASALPPGPARDERVPPEGGQPAAS